jgi:DNA repair exonuclease SbcCD nuclease subunit
MGADAEEDHVRLLHFSDLHLDGPGAGQAVFERVCALAQELRVDAVCGAGNLFEHDTVSSETGERLRAGFAGISPIPVFLAPGRTDWLSPGGIYRQTAWSDNVHVFTEPHLTPLQIASGVTLWGAAHIAPIHALGFLGTGDVAMAGLNIGLFHGHERKEFDAHPSGDRPTAPFYANQIREAGLHHALLGGIDTPRATADYTYAGGEAVVVTIDEGAPVTWQWLNVEQTAPDKGAADVFAKSATEPEPAPEPTYSEPSRATFQEPDLPESTVLGQFVRVVRQSDLEPADQDRILRIGLAAVEGRTDFGEL